MADVPLATVFGSGSVDTATTLYAGPVAPKSTTLAVELADVEDEVFYVDDATGAPLQGVAVIEEEIILYQRRLGVGGCLDLFRAQGGTEAVTHGAGVSVVLHPLYYIPAALRDAVIELQNRVVALETS